MDDMGQGMTFVSGALIFCAGLALGKLCAIWWRCRVGAAVGPDFTPEKIAQLELREQAKQGIGVYVNED